MMCIHDHTLSYVGPIEGFQAWQTKCTDCGEFLAPVWEVQKKKSEDCDHNHLEIMDREEIDISDNGLRFVMHDKVMICRQCGADIPTPETDTLVLDMDELEEIPF
jgi:hypothetical protein